MRFIDILREAEEEEGVGSARAKYDIAIQTGDTDSVVKALSNINNYGVYAQSLRDPKAIEKVFGPRNPNQRYKAASQNWGEIILPRKKLKIEDAIERNSEWENIKKELEVDSNEEAVNKLSSIEDFQELVATGIFSVKKAGKTNQIDYYYPLKTPDNIKKYGGVLEKDNHFYVKDDKIVFPFDKSPYSSKPYLQKVLNTIMNKADVKYKLVDVERLDSDEEGEVLEKPKKEKVPPLTVTADSLDKIEKIRNQFKKEIGDVATAKYETEPVDIDGERKYKLIITGISVDQRKKLFIKKAMLKEEIEFNLDLYLMQKRAGL